MATRKVWEDVFYCSKGIINYYSRFSILLIIDTHFFPYPPPRFSSSSSPLPFLLVIFLRTYPIRTFFEITLHLGPVSEAHAHHWCNTATLCTWPWPRWSCGSRISRSRQRGTLAQDQFSCPAPSFCLFPLKPRKGVKYTCQIVGLWVHDRVQCSQAGSVSTVFEFFSHWNASE